MGPDLHAFYSDSAFRLVLILMAVICPLYALRNLYDGRRYLLKRTIAWDVIAANATALAIFYTYWYLQRNVYHPRSFFASVLLINTCLCIGLRQATDAGLDWMRLRFGFDRYPVLLTGTGKHTDSIASLIDIRQPHGMTIAARLAFDPDGAFDSRLAQLREAIRHNHAALLICDCQGNPIGEIMQILEMTQDEGIPVKILSDELAVLVTHARLPCDLIHGEPLVHFNAPAHQGRIGLIRQFLTVLVASIALLLLSPLMLLIAAIVRLTSRGPAIFVQERIGVNRKPFRLYKFRTMHDQAEELLAEVEEFNESDGALFKIRNDPRITFFGRFLRRFSLDELPQLFNVIKGDMAIVGPRPLPRRDFEHYYEQWHYSRHLGLPGLTCLWQISGRSHVSFHNMCILDIYYLRNHNWVLDLKIALKTIRVVLFGEGAF
jgi:exopolysaccharide biosynthesis polyprenyl glycosylphosphotransferase